MPANVFINGMEVSISKKSDSKAFFGSILSEGSNFKEIPSRYGNRTIVIQSNSKHVAGLIFVDTEQGQLITTDVKNGVLVPSVRENDDGMTRKEFIHFVLSLDEFADTESNNRKNIRGVFTQYRGSGGIGVLRSIFPELYSMTSAKLEKADRVKMLISNLAKDYDFFKELKGLHQISAFEYSVPKAVSGWFGPISKHIGSTRGHVTFAMDSRNLADVKSWIPKFIKEKEIEGGKAYGQDVHGSPLEIPIDPEKLAFSKLDFDKVAKQANFDTTNLFGTDIVKQLISVMKREEDLFYA